LEIFDKKFKLAKEDASDLRGALKRLEGREFDEDIDTAKEQIHQSEVSIEEHSQKCEEYQQQILDTKSLLNEMENKIASIPLEIVDIKETMNAFKTKKNDIRTLLKQNTRLIENNDDNNELSEKLNNFLKEYDVENLLNKKKTVETKNEEYEDFLQFLKNKNKDINTYRKKVSLLQEVPCGESFPTCKFICDAHKAKDALPNMLTEVNGIRKQSVQLLEDIHNLDIDKLNDYLNKYDLLVEKQKEVQQEVSVSELEIQNNLSKLEVFRHEIENIEKQITAYEENKEAIENLEQLISKKKKYSTSLKHIEENCAECQQELNDLYISHGSCEQKLQSLVEQKSELAELREDYSAYDLFMRCMHTSGISYDIIKKKLPAINEEIAKVLANIVNFEVFFEDDGRRLNVYIKHPKHEPRPIEMGSGAEKTIASMAIRLALLHVSNLPKSNIFILDEPGTALDAENLEGFVRILDMVKSYFKTVILISHLDSLKDCVDYIVNIEKKNGYAHVSQ